MAADITLYTNPMSRGRTARWMLEEVGVAYDTVVLEYDASMKADDYLAVNPMGKVPAIVHGGRVVTECAAICAYLADAFPAAGLAPATDDRADYYRWLFFGAGPVEQAVTDKARGVTVSDAQSKMVGYGNYDTVVGVLEDLLADGRTYLLGDRFGALDVYLGSQLIWGTQFGTLPKQAVFLPYVERLTQREAYGRASALDDAAVAAAEAG